MVDQESIAILKHMLGIWEKSASDFAHGRLSDEEVLELLQVSVYNAATMISQEESTQEIQEAIMTDGVPHQVRMEVLNSMQRQIVGKNALNESVGEMFNGLRKVLKERS